MCSSLLKKELWPGFIMPKENELFSSWFIRLCYEHRIKSYTFSKLYFEGQPIWNRDIDRLFPQYLVNAILEHTILNYNQVKEMFLISYKDLVFNDADLSSFTMGILNLGVYHRKRKQFGLLCCPSCLVKENPYYKKEWRLAFSLGCTKCKCYLIDRCPNCLNPIAFHRLETGYKEQLLNYPLYTCSFCKFDLRKSIKTYLSFSTIDNYQKYIDKTLGRGYNDITQYSFTYFSVLLFLSNQLLTSSKKWDRIKVVIEDYFNTRFTNNNKEQYHSLDKRRDSLLISYKILKNWPKQFNKIFKDTNVRYSDFSKEFSKMPFWLEKTLKDLH